MTETLPIDPRLARVAPTWEVELLISGVAIFAMLQLPGWLDDRMFALEPQIDSDWRTVLLLCYFYAKSAAVVLAITFAAHLLLRAQWVALMGMHSVYPQGVRLDKMRIGPIQRAIEAVEPDTTVDVIERADNRASVLFAIGVSVALLIAFMCVFFCGALVLVNLLLQTIGWDINPMNVMTAAFALLMLPILAAGMFDQARGARLQRDGLAHRLLSATLRFYIRIGMGRRNNHVLAVLTSNGGERRMMALVIGVMLAALIGVIATYKAMQTSSPIGSYGLFPDAREFEIDAAHYDDQRDATRADAVPYIDSMVVDGPYLRLTVPYEPRRDGPAMRTCKQPADANPVQQAQALLTCLQGVRSVLLDGQPMKGLRYEIASDPRTVRPALLAMIDVRALAPGRHELLVGRPLDPGSGRDRKDPTYRHYRIVFWR